ncbi:MAG: hypothetical protein C5B52_03960 [Bacteroidetes bacterium]|nr:MAG: hypothetical protein C5B52_03960 [Bacteroidota bacterium]
MNTINTNPQENPITEFYETVLEKPVPVSAGTRLLNYLIDLVVLFVIFFAILFGSLATSDDSALGGELMFNVSFYLVFLAYYFFCEVAMGRTVGKLLTGTKVVNEIGGKPSAGQILGRTFSRIVPFEAFSFLGNTNGWHDRWSHTTVVKINKDKN